VQLQLERVNRIVTSRKVAIATGAAIILIVIIDLLMTRQILPYYNDTEAIMFILTLGVGYGLGSWILLGYVKRVSKEIRAKSRFINLMDWTVTVIQFSLLGILLFILFSGNSNRFLSPTVFAISSIAATAIMGVIAFKFFSWYKLSSSKNLTVLLYGIAAIAIAMSIAEDAGTKLTMIQVIEEKSPPGTTVTKNSFLYKASAKYNGEIEYKVVNPQTTTLYILPKSNLALYNLLNSVVLPVGFVIRWGASTMLLRSIYQRMAKLPVSYWVILCLPLVLYLIGKTPGFFSGESLAGVDEPYRYYFRILFRAGTIAGNILFGVAFFMVARRMLSSKIKDYLIISAIGDTIVGISLSTSALQQTFGMAGHSLVLLSSFLFSIGLYLSAISVSQDSSLRKSIRTSAVSLIDNIGSAQMEQEIKKNVTNLVHNKQKEMELLTGGLSYVVTENDLKEYMAIISEERKRSKVLDIDHVPNTVSNANSTPATATAPSTSKETEPEIITREKGKEYSSNITLQSLIEKIQSSGATVETLFNDGTSKETTSDRKSLSPRLAPSSVFIKPGTSARYTLIHVSGDPVRVFEFEDPLEDDVVSLLVNSENLSKEGSDASGQSRTYIQRFYRASKLIVEYNGNNNTVLSILANAFGQEFVAREVKSTAIEKTE
jgi:hypothetical protein